MLDKVKLSLGVKDNEFDDILELMIDDMTQAVLAYCNQKILPVQLEPLIREMVINKFNAEKDNDLQSIKLGDTQSTYCKVIGIEDFTPKQKSVLNRYRRISII